MTKLTMHCAWCGSTEVTRDAWACWDEDAQEWTLGTVYDHAHCHDCDGETRIEERPADAELRRRVCNMLRSTYAHVDGTLHSLGDLLREDDGLWEEREALCAALLRGLPYVTGGGAAPEVVIGGTE